MPSFSKPFLFVGLCWLSATVAFAQQYTVTDLGGNTEAHVINAKGEVGGTCGVQQACFCAPFRAVDGPKSPVIVWLNLNSKQEVDELFERWKDSGAKIIETVADKPWHLREFKVADLDGNQLRVFYDFHWEMSEERSG